MATPEATKSAEGNEGNKNAGSPVSQTEDIVVPDNPFINFMVRFPCATAGIVMVFSMICVILTVSTVRSYGADIFSESSSYEPSDKRSLEWNAFAQAAKEARALSGESGDQDDQREYPQQTQDGAVVLTVYVAKDDKDNVFTSSNLARIKEVEDKILDEKDFTKFCKREDRSGEDITCKGPLSPLNLFYAPQVNIKDIFDELDAMDGTVDGKLGVMATPHLSVGLSNLHAVTLGMLGPLLSGGAAPSAEIGNCVAQGDQSAIVACLAGVLVSTMENPPNKTVVDVYAATAPLVLALMAKRGDDQQDVEATLKLAAYMRTVGFYAPFVDYYFDNGFSVDNPKSKHSRGMISFGVPLEGFKNRDDRRSEQDKKLEEWFSGAFSDYLKDTSEVGDVEVLFFATPLIFAEFIQILLFDALKVLISLVLVFLWIFAQTNSLFIAVAGVAEIILSVPVAFFLYWHIFQLRYFDGLNAMTVFIVTAIGADDIFVFMDQYKQSIYVKEVCIDLKTRMNWVYGRAAWAMFITSFTTMAAFICTAFSPLPDVKSFGIFSSIVIFVDYILVITWFPACVVFYHNYLEPRPLCCECNKCEKMWPCQRGVEETSSARALARTDEVPQKRFMERMLSGPFAAFLKRFAPFIVVFFLILAIPLSYLASEIKELSSAEEALPSDHPFQRVATLSGEAFPSSAQLANTPVYVVWGVKEFDISGTNIMFADPKDEEAKGKLVFDSNFVFDAATQQHIWNVCDEVRRMDEPGLEDFLSRDSESTQNSGKIKCPLEDWKNYVEQMNMTFPVPIAEVGETMEDFMEYRLENEFGQTLTMQEKWGQSLGFDKGRKEVILVILEVETKLMGRRPHPSVVLKREYEKFEAWMDVINDPDGRLAAPASAGQAFQTSDGDFNGPNWVWMHTQSLYRSSAIQGAIIGTVLAFVVILIATQQIIIALASLVTIACILASVLAAMRLADYEMGTITSICITILAGFAVDYVVHLAHAYNHSKKETRTEKFQDAIDVIGVSVLSGMITSVVAAIVLMFCVIQFFSKFGFFLFFTVAFAWVWGNLFFMCLMKIIGPDQNTNKWLQLPYSLLPKRGRSCCAKRYLTVTAQMQEKEP